MPEPLSPEAYAQRQPPLCPRCQALRLSYSYLEAAGTVVTQQVGCLQCGAQWYDVYTLAGYMDLSPTEEDDDDA